MAGTRAARAVRAAAMLGVAAVLTTACSEEPPAPKEKLIEFSATGTSGGTAFGQYILIGDLPGTGMTTFRELPFSVSIPVPYTSAPKMSVSLVDVPPGSTLSCRITIDGETVAEQTVDAPGNDARCVAGS